MEHKLDAIMDSSIHGGTSSNNGASPTPDAVSRPAPDAGLALDPVLKIANLDPACAWRVTSDGLPALDQGSDPAGHPLRRKRTPSHEEPDLRASLSAGGRPLTMAATRVDWMSLEEPMK